MREDYILDPEKFVAICDKLEVWRKERHIEEKAQVASLYANILEELSELERALLANDEESVIDAYCDIVVFLLNAYDLKSWFLERTSDGKVISLAHMPIKTSVLNNIKTSVYKSLGNICVDKVKNMHKEVYSFVSFIYQVMYMYGYDPLLCMEEAIKHISSRVGKWDETIKKFVKDTSDEAKANWYEPNYGNCKLD